MAKGTYISEHLNEEQTAFLKYLNENEILYFRLSTIKEHLPENLSNINDLAENLYHKGLLKRVERAIYVIPSYQNTRVLATFIAHNSSIAYWSALHYHGLTERFPNTIFVKTTQRKRNKEILGNSVRFVTVKKYKDNGTEKIGYGDDCFRITDIEMTMVDCFDQPMYAGNLADLIKAFAKAKLINKKLISYTETYNNIALIKRMGYLATLFHKDKLKSFIRYARGRVNQRYNLIDAGGAEKGEFISEWKLRLNVSEERLLKMANDEY